MKFKTLAMVAVFLLCIPFTAQAKAGSSASVAVVSEAENVNETFTYVLSDADGEVERMTVASGKESSFLLSAEEPGVESYTIHQIPGKDTGATYDKTVYCVDVHTVIEDDVMWSEPVIYIKGTTEKYDKCRFLNKKPLDIVPDDKKPESNWHGNAGAVQTGDESNLELWTCLAVGSALGLLLLWAFSLFGMYRKSRNGGKES